MESTDHIPLDRRVALMILMGKEPLQRRHLGDPKSIAGVLIGKAHSQRYLCISLHAPRVCFGILSTGSRNALKDALKGPEAQS